MNIPKANHFGMDRQTLLAKLLKRTIDAAAIDSQAEAEHCLETFDVFDWKPKHDADRRAFKQHVELASTGNMTTDILDDFLNTVEYSDSYHPYFYLYLAESLTGSEDNSPYSHSEITTRLGDQCRDGSIDVRIKVSANKNTGTAESILFNFEGHSDHSSDSDHEGIPLAISFRHGSPIVVAFGDINDPDCTDEIVLENSKLAWPK